MLSNPVEMLRRSIAFPAEQRSAALAKTPGLPIDTAYRVVAHFGKDEIRDFFRDDPWNANYVLNLWECIHNVDVLETLPWNVSLPLADVCNARCTFCTSWFRGRRVMTPENLERYVELLRVARLIGLQGHGEPLINPHISAILQRIIDVKDSRSCAYLITNGVHLEEHLDLLLRANVVTFNISLNATTQSTHDVVMGLGPGAFEKAMSAVKAVLRVRDNGRPDVQVNLSFVLTADNLKESIDFVSLCNQLRVNTIYLRTLHHVDETEADSVLSGLNYHDLAPLMEPKHKKILAQLREEVALSEVRVEAQPETWEQDSVSAGIRARVTNSPPPKISREMAVRTKEARGEYESLMFSSTNGERVGSIEVNDFNPYSRRAPFDCAFPYHNLVATELNFRVNPCCQMSEVPGHNSVIFDGSKPFVEYWNSPAFVFLRQSLRKGPLLDACRVCVNQGRATVANAPG